LFSLSSKDIFADDPRLPHIKLKLTAQIHKTSLGAEKSVSVIYYQKLIGAINNLKEKGYQIVALEQSRQSVLLNSFKPGAKKIALVLGPEVIGLNKKELSLTDLQVEIPMAGIKESFNVSVAAGIALYQILHCS
jgi:tRNA G18 (ribose-2'-O)-methylase SpoU